MIVNYIYNKSGQIEYAVIPYEIWDSIKNYAIDLEIKSEKKQEFDPGKFVGMLSHYNFDLESELQEIRNQKLIE
jgi:hypothetical protein